MWLKEVISREITVLGRTGARIMRLLTKLITELRMYTRDSIAYAYAPGPDVRAQCYMQFKMEAEIC